MRQTGIRDDRHGLADQRRQAEVRADAGQGRPGHMVLTDQRLEDPADRALAATLGADEEEDLLL